MNEEKKAFSDVIIVYDYAYVNGGAANVAIQTALVLSENYNVYYFAAVGPVCKELENSKVKVVCLNQEDINTSGRVNAIINGVWNRKAKKSFGDFIRGFNPQTTVLHIHGWSKALSVSVIAEAEKQGFTPIITLHDYFCICPNGGFYDYKKCEICKLKSMSVKCVLTNCDKRSYLQKLWRCLRQLVQDKYVKNNSAVVYVSISDLNESLVRNVARSEKFIRVDNPVMLSEKKNASLPDNYQFIYVGRISEEKGVELFCQAIEQAKKTVRGIEGIVIGDGEKRDELIRKYEQIEFTGWKTTEQVQKYMRSARALVFPSKWYEGAPLTIIEALSAGLPCIVSDCTSATEIISNGENGMVFHSGSTDEMSKDIVMLCDDSYRGNLVESIVKNFSHSHYSLEQYSHRVVASYKSAMRGCKQ